MPTTPRQEVFSDRYETLSLIAHGGMAEVWLAHDLLLDRTVALKVLFPELSRDRSFVERFRREAQAAANLSHPNIVSVFDWGEAGDTYYIVMEYVDGRPLSRLLRDEGPLLADRAAGIGADAAAALGFAHRNGVVHRDVKPGNVLITAADHVKVTDFGIAQAANTDADHLTKTGAVMGTATYFSPEQAQGLPVDARSDVYSLGVVLYEMVTGTPPFVADSPVATAYKHVHEPAPPPTEITPELPRDFESVVMQAMAKDVDRRYLSAEELRADLLRFRQGRTVLAEPYVPASAAVPEPEPEPTPPPPPPPPPPRATRATPANPVAVAATAATDAEPEADLEDHGSLWGYAVLLAVLVIALGIMLFLLGRQLSLFGATGGTATATAVLLPGDLIGQKYENALAELNKAGINVINRKDINDAAHPADTVTATNPAAGTAVRHGAPVEVDVASGPPPVTVPDVVGEALNLAITQLKKSGFVVAPPVTTDSTTVAAGQVMAQNPAQLTQAHQGDTINLTVSDGRGQVLVPDETNKDEATAEHDLQQGGFETYVVRREHSATVSAGAVIKTVPPVGSPIAKGGQIGLVISSGAGQVQVPYVDGDDEATARGAIEDLDLVVSETAQAVSDPTQAGVVLAVNPAPGTTVVQGSTVNLVVGRYSAGVSGTPTTG